MKTVLKNIDYLVTMNEKREELKGAYIVVEDGIIVDVGRGTPLSGDVEIDLSGRIITPGFVNTHHHFYQSLFRSVKEVASAKLFDWLVFLYERWKNLDNEAIYVSSKVAIYEMMASGVTTTTDMLYLHPTGRKEFIDSEIEAARSTGVRFHPTRGSMSLSTKDGGLPPDTVVQSEREIIEDSVRLIVKYHDREKHSMLRIALAPCSPFSVTEESMVRTAELAGQYDVLLHTHLAETRDEDDFCIEKKGLRPVDFMEKVGWLNERSWFAHLVWLSDEDIKKLAEHDCGMAHCPSSNMRLGSGIARVKEMKEAGIRISLAVDGSSSNDTGNMLLEIRNALMLQRVLKGADALSPRDVLEFATLGGAKVLRMDDYIGSIEPGKSADLAAFRLDTLSMAGGLSDPVASLVLCDPHKSDLVMIDGKIRVQNGRIVDGELSEVIKRHNEISCRLIES
ncbi:8-oxoguanine deaminase [Mesotoga sp. BH458_6_3_2_1]|uniref:8-oxoguanine deaminase n=1 Tax=Mesotoga sp. BH458_6_3_2_1 TaxID=1437446 RepID=UPI000EF23ED1|nr:8-oxoguanine deaminase [Mesotoga sp. BH458_6_3_2_1]RLL81532.1 hydroxydechloroatrazine ethylaminohydrolase [Mesotoga sp. BH458_6_3_2_1]